MESGQFNSYFYTYIVKVRQNAVDENQNILLQLNAI